MAQLRGRMFVGFVVLLTCAASSPPALASTGEYEVEGSRDYLVVREFSASFSSQEESILVLVAPSGAAHQYPLPIFGPHILSLAPFDGQPAAGRWTILMRDIESVQIEVEVHILDASGFDGAQAGRSVAIAPQIRTASTWHHLLVWDERADAWLVCDPGVGPPDPGDLPPVYLSVGSAPPPIVPQGATERPYVVVAVLDTGINPYHAVYRRPALTNHPATYVAGYPADATALDLAQPIAWSSLQRQKVYWFPGTNVIGAISFGEVATSENRGVIIDDDGHGTGTSSNVVIANPNVKIVMVETNGATLEAALDWASDQDWIDIISASWGTPGNLPTGGLLASYSRDAANRGKIVVFSAGNEPTPGHTDHGNGPPWVWSVGGAEKTTHGETLVASKMPDFVSNFTQAVAVDGRAPTNAFTWNAGTSFAAPTVAGVASNVVLRLREAYGHQVGIVQGALVDASLDPLTSADIRSALNRTADYWTAAQYDPSAYQPSPTEAPNMLLRWEFLAVAATAPISPTPWTQMGWGYVGPETVEPAVRLLLGESAAPDVLRDAQKSAAAPFMAANHEFRADLNKPVGLCVWQDDPEPPCSAPEICLWPHDPGDPCRPPE